MRDRGYLYAVGLVVLLSAGTVSAGQEGENEGGGSRSYRFWAGNIHRPPRPERHTTPETAEPRTGWRAPLQQGLGLLRQLAVVLRSHIALRDPASVQK